MKEIKRIFKKSVNFYSRPPIKNEDGLVIEEGITVAVCDDVRSVLDHIRYYLAQVFGFSPPMKIVPYDGYKISTKVICQPEDEWNEEYGKILAFNKLYKRQFKSILNNVLSNSLKRIGTADDSLCKILGQMTIGESIEFLIEDFDNTVSELKAKIKDLGGKVEDEE